MAAREDALASLSGRLRLLTAPLRRAARAVGNPPELTEDRSMELINHKPAGIVATELRADQQLQVLTRYLGRPADRIEGEIYGLMRRLSPTYQQGAWKMYEVSSGSIYIAPCVESIGIYVERTSFGGTLSGDAVGIVVSLLGLRHAYRVWGEEELCTAYVRLRDFAQQHAERDAILAATD